LYEATVIQKFQISQKDSKNYKRNHVFH